MLLCTSLMGPDTPQLERMEKTMTRILAVKNLRDKKPMCGHPVVEMVDHVYRCLKCLEENLTHDQVKRAHSRIVAEKESMFADFIEAS